jgi:hypothetical protein
MKRANRNTFGLFCELISAAMIAVFLTLVSYAVSPVGCDTAEPTTVVQGFACVKTPVQNIRSRDRKRASPMTAFGSEAAERLNRRERPVCPERRHLAVEVAGNPVAFSDARQTGVLRLLRGLAGA